MPSNVRLNIPLPTSIFLPRPDLAMELLGWPESPAKLMSHLASESGAKLPVAKKTLRKRETVKEATALKIARWALRRMRELRMIETPEDRRSFFKLIRTMHEFITASEAKPFGNWFVWEQIIEAWEHRAPSSFHHTRRFLRERSAAERQFLEQIATLSEPRDQQMRSWENIEKHTLIEPLLIEDCRRNLLPKLLQGTREYRHEDLKLVLWLFFDPLFRFIAAVEQDLLLGADPRSVTPHALYEGILVNLLPTITDGKLQRSPRRYFQHLAKSAARLHGRRKSYSTRELATFMPDPDPARTRRTDDNFDKDQDAENRRRELLKWMEGTRPSEKKLNDFLTRLAGPKSSVDAAEFLAHFAYRLDALHGSIVNDLMEGLTRDPQPTVPVDPSLGAPTLIDTIFVEICNSYPKYRATARAEPAPTP